MVTTEYAEEFKSGAMLVRWSDPELERVAPLGRWIETQRKFGGHVHRRKIIVVEDWIEVDGV
jgi:hypothetical protein